MEELLRSLMLLSSFVAMATTKTSLLLGAGMLILLILFFFILLCRPWRFFSSYAFVNLSRSTPHHHIKDDAEDVERPLFSNNLEYVSGQNYAIARESIPESTIQVNENGSSPRTNAFSSSERPQPVDNGVNQRDSLILDVPYDALEDYEVGQTLKRSVVLNWPSKAVKQARREIEGEKFVGKLQVHGASLRSSLTLEVIAGPTCGLCCSRQSTDTSMLPLTIGRVAPSSLLLKDSEVSGKHAHINWNSNNSKWELVDMGSLNGTFLNSRILQHPDSGSRRWSEPIELASGDVITLGTSSKIHVQISQQAECRTPCGVGVASDPMALRRGGKRLPMEDMCFFQWPLPGVQQVGVFGIFDGHGGAEAAKAACKILPETIAKILSNHDEKQKIISLGDAANVLRKAFLLTEASMDHQYEGCTATVLLVWLDHNKEIFAQCANVGDSACFMSVNGQQINMSEDHRVTSLTERNRLIKAGKPLKDGEARLSGLNIGRMLGDKFLKEQDDRFSSEPYVSQVVHLPKECTAFALLASDGLWDVISSKKAVQLVLQGKEMVDNFNENPAEKIANYVLSEARAMKTKDNTTVIFLDFDALRKGSCMDIS